MHQNRLSEVNAESRFYTISRLASLKLPKDPVHPKNNPKVSANLRQPKNSGLKIVINYQLSIIN